MPFSARENVHLMTKTFANPSCIRIPVHAISVSIRGQQTTRSRAVLYGGYTVCVCVCVCGGNINYYHFEVIFMDMVSQNKATDFLR